MLVNVKCPNCFKWITVESEKDAAICTECGKPYIVKDAMLNALISYASTGNVESQDNKSSSSISLKTPTKGLYIEAGVLKWYNGPSTEIVIPETVKQIAPEAFKDMKIESVFIPDTVIDIGRYAFSGCIELKKVRMPRYCKNDGVAFLGCPLEEVIFDEGTEYPVSLAGSKITSLDNVLFPKSLKCLPSFKGCTELISANVPNWIEDLSSGFYRCKKLQSVTLPASITIIPDSCFEGCESLSFIRLPESLKRVGAAAFRRCISLTEINLPQSLEELDGSAFKDCMNLERIIIGENTKIVGTLNFSNCSKLDFSFIKEDKLQGIEDVNFHNCKKLEKTIIPYGVRIVREPAFFGCTNLKKVEIPETVERIEERSFDDPERIESVVIKNSLTKIPPYCFRTYWEKNGVCPACGSPLGGFYKKCTNQNCQRR